MSLTIACATCRKNLVLPEALLEQLVSCPSCQTSFTVADQAGRLAIRLPGGEPVPALPRATEEIPTVLPAPKRLPFVPLPGASRPFVFKVQVKDDPEKVLTGELQARVSAAGLELRDDKDCVYPIAVGSPAEYLGGNMLSIPLNGRSITLRIVQRSCQQARLAEDIVLFLGQKRTVPRLKDYRPRLAPRLVAWVPLLLAVCALPFGVAGWVGALTWLTFGAVLSLIGWRMVRNEARPLKARLVRLSVAWCVGLVMLGPLVPGVLYVKRQHFPAPVLWQAQMSSMGRYHVSMPGKPMAQMKPLFDMPGSRPWGVMFAKLPEQRAVFEVWHTELTPEDFEAAKADEHFKKIRGAFLQANPQLDNSTEWNEPLGELPSHYINFIQKSAINRDFDKTTSVSETRLRVVLAKPRVYVLRGTWDSDYYGKLEVQKFFNSLVPTDLGGVIEADPKIVAPPVGKGPKAAPLDKRGPPKWTPAQPHWRVSWKAPDEIADPIGYWPLDEGVGRQIKDVSGMKNHSQVQGSRWIDGIHGKALMFEGPGHLMTLDSGKRMIFPKNTGFTLAFWVATKEPDGPILALGNTFDKKHGLRVDVQGHYLTAHVLNTGGKQLVVDSASLQPAAKIGSLSDGVWHPVALVRRQNGTIELYRDGLLQGVTLADPKLGAELIVFNWGAVGGDPLGVGNAPARQFCQCCVDELCIFDSALAETQIRALAGFQ